MLTGFDVETEVEEGGEKATKGNKEGKGQRCEGGEQKSVHSEKRRGSVKQNDLCFDTQ